MFSRSALAQAGTCDSPDALTPLGSPAATVPLPPPPPSPLRPPSPPPHPLFTCSAMPPPSPATLTTYDTAHELVIATAAVNLGQEGMAAQGSYSLLELGSRVLGG